MIMNNEYENGDSTDLKTKEYFGVLNFGLESVDFF